MKKTILVAALALIVGLLAGFFFGGYWKEREWSQPNVLKRLTAVDASRSSGGDPAPKEGTLVLGRAPFAVARKIMADFTQSDPVVMKVGAVGNGDDGAELHVAFENRGKCAVVALAGVAYGYDAYGKPSKMNKGGEHYVAFSKEKSDAFESSKTHALSNPLKHPDVASLALAQVDEFTCADGSKWSRGQGASGRLEAQTR